MSDKIRPQHLARKAILYIRQSSPYQVIHNLESQKLQYAMEARLHQLGWREIEVVDDDLGDRLRAGHARGIRAHGGRSLPGESGRCRGPRSFPLCPQQPRVAATGRGLPRRGHGAHRSRDGLCTPAQ